MTDPRSVLDAIQQRADAAAPGPWERYDGNEGSWNPAHCVANDAFHNPPSDDQEWPAIDVFVECGTKDDAEFIAHARADVPCLVAALRAVLAYADKIDHPDHGENEERADTCHECRKYAFGRAPWPCVYRRHAEEIRGAIVDALGATDA